MRDPLPGVDLEAASPRPGVGTALWFHIENTEALNEALLHADVPIVADPVDGPFGRTLSFSGPDGYVITVHDKA